MSETVVVTTGESDDSSSDAVAAAEANAHIAERAEEEAEEAAEVAEEAAETAEVNAEVASAAANASVDAAIDAEQNAEEVREIADSIPAWLNGFADQIVARVTGVLAAQQEQPEEESGLGIELSLDSEPEVAPDVAPAEQHPYFRTWGGRK